MAPRRVLLANRAEVALRVLRAVHDVGGEAVAVYAPEDAASAPVRLADAAVALPGSGPAAYLDAAALQIGRAHV